MRLQEMQMAFRVLCVIVIAGSCQAQDCPSDVIQSNREASVFIHVKRTFKTTGRIEEPTGPQRSPKTGH